MRILRWIAAATLVVAVVGGASWAVACPCGGIPGFVLRGEVQQEPVQDWRFANDVSQFLQRVVAWDGRGWDG